MDDQQKQLQDLLEKAGQLEKIQHNLSREIEGLRSEIEALQSGISIQPKPQPIAKPVNPEEERKEATAPQETLPPLPVSPPLPVLQADPGTLPKPKEKPKEKAPTPWEEFIGTNLLNKIGIAILVVGIGFGVKYAIDRDLLDPLTRIILGYLASAGLLITALRIKNNYEAFSAVLLSGAMASLYFVTYAAYDFYALIPQAMAFAMMVVFTVFTVLASLQYNLQVIAIIGLVGAYAVPFLLSDGSGKVLVLFSYMLIINAGILFLSFIKNWKILYYTAFLLTWIIFLSWYLAAYENEPHFLLTMIFSTSFFVVFYIAFLAYKLIKHEAFSYADVVFLLMNSFIEFGIGYSALEERQQNSPYLGLFTLALAVVHFVMCLIIYRSQERYKSIFYFIAGLVLTFITIAVPVQLDGNWVTLIWATEAVMLFWVGRNKNFPMYEYMSYPLLVVAGFSLVQDWEIYTFYVYNIETAPQFTPFVNIHFLTGLWVSAALFVMQRINSKSEVPSGNLEIKNLVNFGLPALFLVIVYLTFFNEVGYYWVYRFIQSGISMDENGNAYQVYDYDLLKFKIIWLIIYSGLFGMILSWVSLKLKPEKLPTTLALAYNYLALGAMLTIGLFNLMELRASYQSQNIETYFQRGYLHILTRYILFLCTLPLLWFNFKIARLELYKGQLEKVERVLFHSIVLLVLSSELVHWLDLAHVPNAFKLGLSILWGLYASLLIVVGLTKNLKYIRIMGIVIFAITIAKLFLYDMAGMSTISKTIVMIILGALMLTSSFLYNRNKKIRNAEQG
jgi:uncharacterized membrane protein